MLGCVCDIQSVNQSPTLWPCSTLVRTPHRLCSQGSHSSLERATRLCAWDTGPPTPWRRMLPPLGAQDAQDGFLALPAPSSSGCDCKMPADHSLSCSPPTYSHGHSGDKAESPDLGMTLQCRHTSLLTQKANLGDKIGTRSSRLPVLSLLPEIKQQTSLQAHVGGVLKHAINKHHTALLDPWQVQNSPQVKLSDILSQIQCS